MAVKKPRQNQNDWRPRSLKFAHWREGSGQVSFAAGRSNRSGRTTGRLHGHARAHSFAVLVHLFYHRRVQIVEIDGVKVTGELGKPDDERARIPFMPRPHPDGSLPRPTRPIAWLRWQHGRGRFLAECRVTQAREDAPWMIAAPYAVESDDRRLLTRTRMPVGYKFKPGRADSEAFRRAVEVYDLSLVGASLVADGQWTVDDFARSRISGALVDPRGRSMTTQLVVVRARPHHGGTLLGVAFSSMGLYDIRRLGRWIAER